MSDERTSQVAFYEEVKRILWVVWDPIGTRELGGPDDEYDGYVAQLVRLAIDPGDCAKLAETLSHIAEKSIGMEPSRQHDSDTAKIIMQAKHKILGP